MIESVFFNNKYDLAKVANLVFKMMGVINVGEIDSSNVEGGSYYAASIFGVKMKIEYNSYDYEDEFKYYISLRKDIMNSGKVNSEMISSLRDVLVSFLKVNFKTKVAYENENSELILC